MVGYPGLNFTIAIHIIPDGFDSLLPRSLQHLDKFILNLSMDELNRIRNPSDVHYCNPSVVHVPFSKQFQGTYGSFEKQRIDNGSKRNYLKVKLSALQAINQTVDDCTPIVLSCSSKESGFTG